MPAVGRDVVRVEARAKLNLGLAVGPRRADGYHDLVTVFQSISLADVLIVRRRRRGLTLSIREENVAQRAGPGRWRVAKSARVPRGRDNLVLRAAELARRRWGIRGGASFRLIKRIPAGAGLGGGSADAAASLLAMARLHGLRPTLAERLALASELGSDVPFAVFGGSAIGRGRGERLTRLEPIRPFRAVVAVPAWRVSTARAFGQIDRIKYGLTAWGRNLRFAQRLERKAVRPLEALRLGNAFEAALGGRRRDFVSICRRLEESGAVHPHLTGSGSAVFGFVPPRVSWTRVASRYRGPERIFLVRSARSGTRFAPHTA
jgi:4-diphosphocytidyl-2-C-methyl-D-erythritol kinase